LREPERSVSSKYGKKLLPETEPAHRTQLCSPVLDAGGMRRATLRGLENLNKRHQIAAACYNLSQILRRLYGIGTPKQWAASFALFLSPLLYLIIAGCRSLAVQNPKHTHQVYCRDLFQGQFRKSRFFNSLLTTPS